MGSAVKNDKNISYGLVKGTASPCNKLISEKKKGVKINNIHENCDISKNT